MKHGVWIPPWVSAGLQLCARFDCFKPRHVEAALFGVRAGERVRRYCDVHAIEYEREASEISKNEKLLRPSCFGERAGVSRGAEERGGAGGAVQADTGGNPGEQPGKGRRYSRSYAGSRNRRGES